MMLAKLFAYMQILQPSTERTTVPMGQCKKKGKGKATGIPHPPSSSPQKNEENKQDGAKIVQLLNSHAVNNSQGHLV